MIRPLLIIAASTLILAVPAMADLTPIGDPVDGNSWSQAFDESGIGQFDTVAVRMTSAGDFFEQTTHSGFSAGGWSTVYEDGSGDSVILATAQGPDVTYLAWNVKFAGPSSNPLAFDYVAFNDGVIVNTAHLVWGPGWTSITNYGTAPSPYWNPTFPDVLEAPIPAPGAVVLGALGLGLVGWVRRRFA